MRLISAAGGLAVLPLVVLVGHDPASEPAPPIRFSHDVLPIFAENCFQCHGPDEKVRKARLRLDTHEGVLKVVVPGNSAASELVRRINASPEDGGMPPPKSHRRLTAQQRETLRRWIDQGAPWGKHWAYETPVRPALPSVQHPAWVRNPIDRFVLARLENEGLNPSPEASRETLIRRVSLDLTGLPPTPQEVDAFRADTAPDAYQRLVDRLLGSQRYGECMALEWLDDARYADTNGYQNDFARTMWPWRDWVIAAFNRNLPFDQFITEQITGDLLPGATLAQKVASGFNRNNRTVTEAGSIDEEWRVENVVDRVETTTAVFLGLTMGCARCHDHKYDPISQKEFYQFYAFFNSINEKGVYTEQRGNVTPLVAVPRAADEQRLRSLDAGIAAAEKKLKEQEARLPELQQRWEKEQAGHFRPTQPSDCALGLPLDGNLQWAQNVGAAPATAGPAYRGSGAPVWSDGPMGKALHLDGKDNSFVDLGQAIALEHKEPFSYGCWVKPEGDGTLLSKMDDQANYRGFDLRVMDGKVEVHLVHTWPDDAIKVFSEETLPRDVWSHVFVTYDGTSKAKGLTLSINGLPAKTKTEKDHLTATIATGQPLRVGRRSTGPTLKGALADVRFYRRALTASELESVASQPVAKILLAPRDQRTKVERQLLADVFRKRHADQWRKAQQAAAQQRKEKTDFEKHIPTVMIMEDLPRPRDTFVLKRGRYDMPDQSQKLEPGVPACLTPMPVGAPRNRLGLARWLTDPANPLTARVTVNRYWQRYFGTGLVKTAENFGIQGEAPSHPQLLDWLATEFIATGWNVKAMQKLLVTSATYRQSSEADQNLVQHDPENRLLARGPRLRLPAEMVRDNALAISGLLVEQVGGPSIKPYQPQGLWAELAGGAGEGPYVQDQGAELYRRSLYIYRKRTVPHPSMTTFDAPSREVCQVRRSRTNTPLQALELLNDVTYVEAARRLGQLMLTDGGSTPSDRLAFGFRRAMARLPSAKETQLLLRGLEHYRDTYRKDVAEAKRFLHHGDSPVDDKLDPVEWAAYTATATILLNLDETITKE